MKKTAVIFLVLAFVQFITIPAFSTDSHLPDTDSSTVQEFSLKTDYTSRANMRAVLFPSGVSLAEEAAFPQETSEEMTIEEDITSLKKKKTGYLLGGIGLIAAGGVCFYQFTQVESEKGAYAGAGETVGERSSTTGGGKAVWVALGAVSAAIGVALISQYSKTNKAIKAKEKELENLSQAQQRLAQAVSR
ncbi:MAG TPA: hypothetical protein ENL46_02565 [Candidatus Aminicenantes bacterium]|nr:hypothetical protein [Candidatus Aminicenantes bacterium]